MKNNDCLSRIFGWTALFLIIAFQATRGQWYDLLEITDKITFWTNAAVALGTLALAGATVWQIRLTQVVLGSEDRRHQQGYAPLLHIAYPLNVMPQAVEFNKEPTRMLTQPIRNIGMGMARDVSLVLRGDWIGENEKIEDQEIKCHLEVVPPPPHEMSLLYVPVCEILQHYNSFDVKKIEIMYKDMFGNIYYTIYDPWHKKEQIFEWKWPDCLRSKP